MLDFFINQIYCIIQYAKTLETINNTKVVADEKIEEVETTPIPSTTQPDYIGQVVENLEKLKDESIEFKEFLENYTTSSTSGCPNSFISNWMISRNIVLSNCSTRSNE